MNQYPDYKIPGFSGVPASKLVMGLLASTSAGGASYYAAPSVVKSAVSTLSSKGISIGGIMFWDSHWD